MKRKHFPLLVISSLLSILFISCVKLPENTIAPSWDATFAFPLGDSTFVLEEMIGDDSTIVVSDDPASLGVLIYQQNSNIDPFFVDSNLVLNGFSMSASQVIGAITINDIDPISAGISVSEWSPDVAPGDSTIFPESDNELEIPFPKMDSFNFIKLDGGGLKVVLLNRLPVIIELRGIIIRNAVGGQIVAEHTQTIVLQAESSDSVSFDLSGKIIEDSLRYEGVLYSPGSNGAIVKIPLEAGTELIGNFENLVVAEANAVLPEQEPFNTDDVVTFDDSTYIERAVFYDGDFSITFNNNLDVAINLDLEISNLKKSDGTTYTESIFLNRNEMGKVISYPNLADWEIVTLTPGTPTNELKYSAIINTVVSDVPSTISKDDSVSLDIEFGDVALGYAEGKIAPTKFDIAESEFSFDLGDLDGNLEFDSIQISNPTMVLNFLSSVNFEVLLNGVVTGSTDNLTKKMEIDLDLPANGDKEFDLNDFGFTDFINSFTNSGEIPNKFTFAGSGIVNPNYASGSVSKTDSVTGGFAFEVPFDFGISGGTFKDTMRIDSLGMSDEDIDAINSVELTLEILNKIPVNLVLTGMILDASDQPLFPFPPSYSPDTEIIIEGPTVDENGDVVSAETTKQVIQLIGDDAKTFISNPNIAIKFSLDTPPLNSMAPVRFRNSDSVAFKIYGKISTKVNNN